MAREDPHFRLRIPETLKAQLEASAAANARSMTAEIVSRLEKSMGEAPTISQVQASIARLERRLLDLEAESATATRERNIIVSTIDSALANTKNYKLVQTMQELLKINRDARKKPASPIEDE